MPDRTKPLYFFTLVAALLTLAGCGFNQQSRFQLSFLPAAPAPLTAPSGLPEPPAVQSNIYLREAPAILRQQPDVPVYSARADAILERARQRFQRGKKFYQAKDAEHARREFDAAVDLMMEASDYPMGNRSAYDTQLDEMLDAVHRYDLAGLGAAVGLEEARFEKAPLEDILEMTFPVDPKLKSQVKEQALATRSQLPLSINDAVLGYIHYFMGRGHRTMIAGLERAGRYRPMIQRILDEEGVPQELIHLAQAESGFLPRAVSRAKATGMWQFVQFRGQQYGLLQTRYTDDRLDPEKATRAAARHLKDLYNQFGDWYLAIAAYNCGPGVVDKAVERTGYADFFVLRDRRVLPAETTNYVPIILAMTIMAKNAAAYGIDGIAPESPLEYDTVEIDSTTHLALVADLTDVPVSELMSMNPALLRGVAPGGYGLHVPKGSAATLRASLQLIPAERRASWRLHKVESGETLAAIGKRYGTAASSIVAVNNLTSAAPEAGDRLVIPAAVKEDAPAKRSTASSARRTTTTRRATTAHRTSSAHSAAKRPASRTASSKTASKSGATKTAKTTPARKSPRVVARTAANRSRASASIN